MGAGILELITEDLKTEGEVDDFLIHRDDNEVVEPDICF